MNRDIKKTKTGFTVKPKQKPVKTVKPKEVKNTIDWLTGLHY